MPWTIPQSPIVQPSGNRHHRVSDGVLPVTEFVLDDAAPLHASDCVLNPHPLTGNAAIFGFLFRRQFATTRFLGRLLDQDVEDREPLKAHILIQDASDRKGIRFVINQGFIMPLSRIGSTHEADDTPVVNQENVLDGMTFLLTTVIFGLFISIYGSLDGPFGAIMIKKGGWSTGAVSVGVTRVARRAGTASSRSNACRKIGRKSWSHLFASD